MYQSKKDLVEQDEKMAKYRASGRHMVDPQKYICWCGSPHSWDRATRGVCSCRDLRCERTHIS